MRLLLEIRGRVLERVPPWDHDQRVPLGFAASIKPMPSPYGRTKES